MGERGRAAPVPAWIGRVAAPVYGAAIALRNRAFDAGRGVERVAGGVPVISVGNLSVGGTGKTPMVMHIVGLLRRAGKRPSIAMRGYKGERAESREQRAGGDEADVYRRAFGDDVPIVAQPDRLAGLRDLASQRPGAFDCVVLDDGFQHRRIARELDLVLIDATRPPERDRLLPAGWLREPVESLQRASGVVITHAEASTQEEVARLGEWIERVHGRRPLAVTRHLWTGLASGDDQDGRPRGLDALAGTRVFAACAIGNPEAFERTLRMTCAGIGSEVVGVMALADHDPYAEVTVERLIGAARSARADVIVVTDKDWSKLRRVDARRWPAEVVRPVLTMAFDAGAEELEKVVLAAVKG